MTARYCLTLQAKQDFAGIAESIAAEGGLEAAASVVERLRESFQFLADQPGVTSNDTARLPDSRRMGRSRTWTRST